MINFKYKTDLSYSYLVVEEIEMETRNDYQYKMLLKNELRGILRCSERLVEGKATLSYDITSLQPLTHYYKDREISFEELSNFFQETVKMLEGTRNYLLNENYFVMKPDTIFVSLESGRLFYLFLPCNYEKNKFRELADFFLEKTNHRDEHAVNIAYQFYKSSKEDFFSLQSFLSIIEKEIILKNQSSNTWKQIYKEESETSRDSQEYQKENQEDLFSEKQKREGIFVKKESLIKKEVEKKKEQELKKEQEVKKKYYENEGNNKLCKHLKSYLVLSCLGTISVVAIYASIPLDYHQLIALLSVGAALLLCSIILAFKLVKARTKERENNPMVEEEVDLFLKEEEEMNDQTVFFAHNSQKVNEQKKGLFQICWEEEGISRMHMLQDFPITIGKLKNEVSVLIKDSSVSRIHCKIEENYQGKLTLMDLNSTNGTFVNHVRLEQSEKVGLEPGDEIQLGTVFIKVSQL